MQCFWQQWIHATTSQDLFQQHLAEAMAEKLRWTHRKLVRLEGKESISGRGEGPFLKWLGILMLLLCVVTISHIATWGFG
ncbi:hypothetical protein GOP47_0030145 [Adiantum capillus-veneris]|nr:hypothetical protein GOP47_0030145 [Adiantum capillus-veneris]